MPCLNEAATLAGCIGAARQLLVERGLSGEIIVADNGSSDGSPELAQSLGVRVVCASPQGYGFACRAGIKAALAPVVLLGDADGSYDFSSAGVFLEALKEGAELVIGDRFTGGIEAGAMPPLHQRFGNPFMSWMGRWLFAIELRDFHCGLRALRRDRYEMLGCISGGFEFSSELILRSHYAGLGIAEVPTPLCRSGRGRAPHLRSFRDGLRHLLLRLSFRLELLVGAIGAGLVVLGLGLIFGAAWPLGLGVLLLGIAAWFARPLAAELSPGAQLIAKRLS